MMRRPQIGRKDEEEEDVYDNYKYVAKSYNSFEFEMPVQSDNA